MSSVYVYTVALVLVALIFDFLNGFHDSANIVATMIGQGLITWFIVVASGCCDSVEACWRDSAHTEVHSRRPVTRSL